MNAIDSVINNLSEDVKQLITKAYDEGFNDGLGIKLPTQKEFDQQHSVVCSYGEESEWLVLTAALDEEKAQQLFSGYLMSEFGADEEQVDRMLDTMHVQWIGYKRPDGEDDPIYWISKHESPTYWKAWAVDTQ